MTLAADAILTPRFCHSNFALIYFNIMHLKNWEYFVNNKNDQWPNNKNNYIIGKKNQQKNKSAEIKDRSKY